MLTEDYELSREDIQLLSSRDALAALFAKLGYDTNDRLVQNVAAMGFTSDTLKSAITHIERLASQDARMFEVYLFELKSVTVAHTQAIVRTFRNRPGDYLLVLTDDYQRLDFVLVERYTSEYPKSPSQEPFSLTPSAPRQVGVRPRVLTVNRRNPDEVALRVLRRFSYTESDTIAQYEKLLSAYDVADWSEPFFNNRALFSDYYLTTRLPETAEWKSAEDAGAMTRAFRKLRELYAGVRETFSNPTEEAVRARLLEPVLTTLGFIIQPIKTKNNNTAEPDYKLYATLQPSQTNYGIVRAPLAGALSTDKPLALCLAYTWGRNLDGKDEQRDNQTPEENPGAVVVTLLDSGETDWAIVTNGKTWRLYSARAHSRATNYYEIDLEETLAQSPAHLEYAFRYFWLFFRSAAFLPSGRKVDGETRQMCFLDSLVNESERYARELGERLKDRGFSEIFPHFARGFILYARRAAQLPTGLNALPAEERNRLLEPFFSGTLTFLYRLLFLLYAESRDLLPVREVRGYHEKSLEKLKREIAAKAGPIEDQAPALLKTTHNELSTALYDRLQLLFHAVDRGDADLNVPVYNGGLFITQPDPSDTSPEAAVARFLATCKIPDRLLALGLDRMARDLDEKRQDLAFIDYNSLGVRQLGSIYEGLLEFKLHIAPEMMAAVKGKKTEEIVSYAEAQQKKLTILKEGRGKDARDKTLPKGAVYLENDRRERKATGSYYTPDYIVKYIVEHTVGPVLNEKLEALRPIFREAEKMLRTERDKVKALRREDISAEHETYKKYRKTLNDAFFDLKVLDPAMGSGHFLVEAVDYITDRVADFLTAFRWNPVVYELAQTRREIQAEMERQNVTIDMSKLTDLNLLKRRVLKSCIYGVDLNPMAVELAKVSLWLDCFTLGAPLSFLDHHMKCGNSLIGGHIQEVQDSLSLGLWGNQFAYLLDATQLMRKVGELSDVTAQEVAESRKAYKGAYDALAPFKRLLDVWVSEYFGNKGAKRITQDCAGAIVNNDYSETGKGEKQAIETAHFLAQTKRFFHWELEFPEVFFDESKRKDNGGFDAVVGNPPYFLLQSTDLQKPLGAIYHDIFSGSNDISHFFLRRANDLTQYKGFYCFIVARYWIEAQLASELRRFLSNRATLRLMIDFGNLQVWPDINVLTVIALFEAGKQVAKTIVCVASDSEQLTAERFLLDCNTLDNANRHEISSSLFTNEPWRFRALGKSNLWEKVNHISISLDSITENTQGIKTGNNEAFTVSDEIAITEHLERDWLLPLAQAEYVHRYELSNIGEWIIYTDGTRNISQAPKILEHLLKFKEELLKRAECNQGMYEWWRLQRSRKSNIVRANKRLLVPLYATENRFFATEYPFIGMTDVYIIVPVTNSYSIYFLSAALNSTLLNSYHRVFCKIKRAGYLEYSGNAISRLPIRRINFTLSPEQRAYYLEKAKNLYEYCLSKNDQACVLGFVEHHLSKEPEESDVVHDLLAFLADEMIHQHKEKRAAQKEFLNWLVTTLRILPDKEGRKGIDVLTGKGKLADYPGDYQKGESPLAFEELLEILQKNKGHLGMSLSDAGLVEKVRKEYEGSLERVLPLKERLAKTDALIDQVVYRLYGLTEEEINIVEGKGRD